MLVDFFKTGLVDGIGHVLALWVSLIAGFLLLLGLANIGRVHLQRLRRGPGKRPVQPGLVGQQWGLLWPGC